MPGGLPTRGRSTEKKALLVGIGYSNGVGRDGTTLEPIPTSIPNVRAFEKYLKESQGYTNIVVMTDEDVVQARYQPTKDNLKREIKAFGRGVRSGDRLVFYFAGHSEQMPCQTNTEEDGQDEVLVALNGRRIRDNTLNKWLVRSLPKGSALTAIFDSCNSGTLLDLGHYHCNDVYRPWVNKGGRRSNTLRNYVVRRNAGSARSPRPSPPGSVYRKGSGEIVRRNCRSTRSPPPSPRGSIYRKGSGETSVHFSSLLQLMMGEPQESAPSPKDLNKHLGQRTASPERAFPCDGWCRNRQASAASDYPDVISISSSNDGQISWDASTDNGGSISMTTYMIRILKKNPEITTSELMTRLNHSVHAFTRRMHGRVQEESRARRKGEGHTDTEDTESEHDRRGEMDNFQDLQLGSMTPLDMNRPFVL